jgi:hypothetical protein
MNSGNIDTGIINVYGVKSWWQGIN